MTKLCENSELNVKKRVWELDALRGFLILSVLCYHLYMTVEAFCIDGYYNISSIDYVKLTDPLFFWFTVDEAGHIGRGAFAKFAVKYMQPLWVNVFFIVSGISYGFSRNHLKGGIRLLLGAAFVGCFTKLLVIYTGDETQFIRFGALHCYAVCHLIHYFLLEERSNNGLLLIAAVSLVLGYYLDFIPLYSNLPLLVPFGVLEKGVSMRDYWPVFPMLGWFLIGIVLGRKYYGERRSLFPEQEKKKWHRPLRFFGRHSGLIYCGHMVVYSLVFIGIGHIFALY